MSWPKGNRDIKEKKPNSPKINGKEICHYVT